MEATGVYQIPLIEVLERMGFGVVLVIGRQTKRPAARKSDVLDCQWIQQMMMFGLLSGSFRPADALCAIRAVVRLRARLIRDGHVRAVQQMDKALVQMNVQLESAAGRSCRQERPRRSSAPSSAAKPTRPRWRRCATVAYAAAPEVIARSLGGNWRQDEHLLELKHAVATFDLIQAQIAECDSTIAQAGRRAAAPPARSAAGSAQPFAQDQAATRRRSTAACARRCSRRWAWT